MENMREVLNKVDHVKVSEVMIGLLEDEETQTYDMFEDIVDAYELGDESFRKGMEKMFQILTWKTLEEFVTEISTNCLKGEE